MRAVGRTVQPGHSLRPARQADRQRDAAGTSVNYTWGGGGGNGRAVSTYHVCFDNSCSDMAAGSKSVSYGYNQTHTITAYVVDTAGQQSASVSASATTVSQPATVSVARGNNEAGSASAGGACAGNPACFNFHVTVSGFPANTNLSYTCADNGGVWWTAGKDWSNAQIAPTATAARPSTPSASTPMTAPP